MRNEEVRMTNEEVRKAIEKYQEKHPLPFGMMLDVTAISSKEGVDIISQTIEQVIKKAEENTEWWCICEMAKMYMQGVKPVYPVRPQDEFSLKELEGWLTSCGYASGTVEDKIEEFKRYIERSREDE